MEKRRWKLGSYELAYNPKSYGGEKSSTGEINITANGIVSSNNLYYQDDLQFVFDIYEKPTKILPSIKTYASNFYSSISEDENTANLTILRSGTNLYDVINKSGTTLFSAKSVNLDAGAIVSCIVRINSSNVACMFPTGSLIICGDNGIQISKYTYSDQEIKDTVSITWDNGNFLYLLNKFGKIFKVNRNDGVVTPLFAFGDFTDNKLGNIPTYKGIHFTSSGHIGVVKGNRVIYLDSAFEVAHSIEFSDSTINSISFGFFSGHYFMTTQTRICGMTPNMSTIEVEKVKAQLSNGAVALTDENNISKVLFITQMSVKRIRSLQESRYEIAISGQLS